MKLLCVVLLISYAVIMGVGTLQATEQLPGINADAQAREGLISVLLHMHISHMYTEYWTCDLTAFLSQEQIVCSVLDDLPADWYNKVPSRIIASFL